MVVLKNAGRVETQSRTSAIIFIVGVRHDHVKSVVTAGHLEHYENRSVLTGYDLGGGAGRQGIQCEKGFFEKHGQRPGRRSAECRGAKKSTASLQTCFHKSKSVETAECSSSGAISRASFRRL